MKVIGVDTEPAAGGVERVTITADDGRIECVFHPAGTDRGVIWLCGALGGLDGPSFGIFRILAERLAGDGVSSLRLHYRHPGVFEDCVEDVAAGVDFLKRRGTRKVALVGHSFGGAVSIEAGARSPEVVAVVGLASQTYGAQRVAELSPRPLLLIHGARDRNLPAECSRQIYRWARQPKELQILEGNGHFLREAHQRLLTQLREWLVEKLGTGESLP